MIYINTGIHFSSVDVNVQKVGADRWLRIGDHRESQITLAITSIEQADALILALTEIREDLAGPARTAAEREVVGGFECHGDAIGFGGGHVDG